MKKKQVGILAGVVVLAIVVVAIVLTRDGAEPEPVPVEGEGAPVEEEVTYEALVEKAEGLWTEGETNAALDLLRVAMGDSRYLAAHADIFEAYMERVRTVWMAGETNVVIEQLLAAVDDVQDAELRERAFSLGEQVLYMAGRAEQAEERFWEALERETAIAAPSVRYVYAHKMRMGDTNGVFELTRDLLERDLETSLTEQIFGWHLNSCLELGRFARLLELVPVAVERFGASRAVNLICSIVQRLVNESKLRDAELLLSKLEQVAPEEPLVAQRMAAVRYELLLKRKDWMTLEQQLMSMAPALDDAGLSRLFSRTCAMALKDGREGMSERLCEFMLLEQKGKRRTLELACRQWIESQARNGQTAGIVERLELLLDKLEIPPDIVGREFSRSFYDVMKASDAELLRRMIVVGERLMGAVTQSHQRSEIKAKVVDGCFAAGEYEKSLKYLEEGLEGRDEAWTAMALCKMRAHVALQKGETDEAVKRFRKFMQLVVKEDDLGQDPTTGVRYTPEMTLGFNAKRIGDIYADAGRAAEATNAYVEAEGFYLQALSDVDKGSKAYEFVKGELAKVPGAKPYEEPVEEERPAKQDEPVEQEKPVERDEPVEQEKPVERDEPVEQGEPPADAPGVE